jgi:hypothetical protein
LPSFHPGFRWSAWMDTSRDDGLHTAGTYDSGASYLLQTRSLVVLMERRGDGSGNGKKEE